MSAWTFVFASGWGLRRLAETGAPALAGVICTGPASASPPPGCWAARWGAGARRPAGSASDCCRWRLIAADLAHLRRWRTRRLPAPLRAPAAPPSAGASAAARSDARWLVGLYGLAGFGYIITATFLPVIARQALPGSPWPDFFWPLFGAGDRSRAR